MIHIRICIFIFIFISYSCAYSFFHARSFPIVHIQIYNDNHIICVDGSLSLFRFGICLELGLVGGLVRDGWNNVLGIFFFFGCKTWSAT